MRRKLTREEFSKLPNTENVLIYTFDEYDNIVLMGSFSNYKDGIDFALDTYGDYGWVHKKKELATTWSSFFDFQTLHSGGMFSYAFEGRSMLDMISWYYYDEELVFYETDTEHIDFREARRKLSWDGHEVFVCIYPQPKVSKNVSA